jgi:hypothetical protein
MDPSTERNLLQRLRDSLFSVPSLSLCVELSRTSLCAGPPPAASLLPVAAPVRLLTSSTQGGRHQHSDRSLQHTGSLAKRFRRRLCGQRGGSGDANVWVTTRNAPFLHYDQRGTKRLGHYKKCSIFALRPEGNQKWITAMEHQLKTV